MPTRYALISLFVALIVLALKSIAAHLTGSLALWSDALESIVNVVTAILTFFALSYSAKPADANHPYGHHKIEYVVATLQGVFILSAAFIIFYKSVQVLQDTSAPLFSLPSILLSSIASGLNAILSFYIIKKGKSDQSPALIAEGKHIFSDVLSSLGVLIGVAIASFLTIPHLDPIMAIIVAFVILISGFQLIKSSLSGLMDEVSDPLETEAINIIINTHKQEAIEAHDIRHRHVANQIFIEFHLVVKGEMSVLKSHEICDAIEAALRVEYTNALITIHVEPEHKAKLHA